MNSEEKLDLGPFGKPNYLVSATPGVGVAKFKTYLKDHRSKSSAQSTRSVGMKKRSNSDMAKRQLTVQKFKAAKKMLDNEKKA